MNIVAANIAPFLDEPIPSGRVAAVDAWLTAISAQLNSTFGDVAIPPVIAPAVYLIVADAIARRLDRRKFDARIKAQATGPSSVQYNTDVTSLSGWFFPEEANQIGSFFKVGGITSIRTPAPDGIRYGNRSRPYLGMIVGMGIEVNENESELEDGDQPLIYPPDPDNPGYLLP